MNSCSCRATSCSTRPPLLSVNTPGSKQPRSPLGVIQIELLQPPRHQLQHEAAAIDWDLGVERWDDPGQRADVVLVTCVSVCINCVVCGVYRTV